MGESCDPYAIFRDRADVTTPHFHLSEARRRSIAAAARRCDQVDLLA